MNTWPIRDDTICQLTFSTEEAGIPISPITVVLTDHNVTLPQHFTKNNNKVVCIPIHLEATLSCPFWEQYLEDYRIRAVYH